MFALLLALQFIHPATLSKPTGYTHAVKAANCTMVFVSGQVALDAKGEVVGKDDFARQAEQVFFNLNEVLKASGASFKDVAKFNTYVVSLTAERLAALRAARNKWVTGENKPASTLVGVAALARPDFLLEVEAVACVPPR
jgi:enamine deaminase RidA (YjgF/YER057c/UK114 family)